MRLSPLDPLMAAAEYGIAFAHFFAGRYEEASSWAEKAVRELRDHHGALRLLAASRALAGRLDGAQEVMSHLREMPGCPNDSGTMASAAHRPMRLGGIHCLI